jgi:hypothetical protein
MHQDRYPFPFLVCCNAGITSAKAISARTSKTATSILVIPERESNFSDRRRMNDLVQKRIKKTKKERFNLRRGATFEGSRGIYATVSFAKLNCVA